MSSTKTMAGAGRRLADRAQAGEVLRPLIRRASLANPVIVGLGVGGLAVAAHARSARSPLGALDVAEFDLPDALRPHRSSGAISSTGRVLLRAPAIERMSSDPGCVRKAVRDTQMLLGTTLLPAWYTGPVVRDRHVVLVDDGGSPPSRLAAAMDFVRRDGPVRVVLAVACAPAERVSELEVFAGEVVVGRVPTWTDWFRWHGDLYDSGSLLAYSEIARLLRA